MTSNTIHKILEEFRKKFEIEYRQERVEFISVKDLEQFLLQSLQQVQKETAEDICKMVDEVEEDNYGTSMDEWKMFKHIRNAIRDKYDPKGFQLEEEEKE